MEFYLAGYYLIKIQPLRFGDNRGLKVSSCSTCINESLLAGWAFPWIEDAGWVEKVKSSLDIEDDKITSIRSWCEQKYQAEKVGWQEIFCDVTTALEYKQKFFSHMQDVELLAVYVESSSAKIVVAAHDTIWPSLERCGIIKFLSDCKLENQHSEERFIGYDLGGVDVDGTLHSFHCNNISQELEQVFALHLNHRGLFEASPNWQQVLDYVNNEDCGVESPPWMLMKIKRVQYSN